jgi:hypothetical protein
LWTTFPETPIYLMNFMRSRSTFVRSIVRRSPIVPGTPWQAVRPLPGRRQTSAQEG